MTAAIGSMISRLPRKRVRALVVTAALRLKPFPDVPAISETVKDYVFVAWIGAFVASGTPKPLVERLNGEIKKALEHPEMIKIHSSQTLDPLYVTPEHYAARLKPDHDKYEKLVKLTGATAN